MLVRDVTWADFPQLVENYYDLYDEVKENPDVGITLFPQRPTMGQETEWFAGAYKRMQDGESVHKVAEGPGELWEPARSAGTAPPQSSATWAPWGSSSLGLPGTTGSGGRSSRVRSRAPGEVPNDHVERVRLERASPAIVPLGRFSAVGPAPTRCPPRGAVHRFSSTWSSIWTERRRSRPAAKGSIPSVVGDDRVRPMKVILFGATGMVGQGVLRECLLDPAVETVLCVGRNPTGQQHPKLQDLVVPNVGELAAVDAKLRGYDACYFCLGATSVGATEEAYRRVTYDLTVAVGTTLARLDPGLTFVYVSGSGTDSTEKGRSMWARVKGATENALLAMPFRAAFMFRPGRSGPSTGSTRRRGSTASSTWFCFRSS